MKQSVTLRFVALLLFAAFFQQAAHSQCFQVESILVDACGTQEGLNEMVRFKAGNTPLDANTMIIDWPNNAWNGIIQNATTASKTAALNTDILAAGGCGQLIEPPGGIIPANATAIIVTSYNLDTALNSFGALTEDIYIIYQNSEVTSGHFANFGTGLRTLTMVFGACTDIVTYDRSLLVDENGINVAANGATVVFDPANNPTYINNGCSAPVLPFSVDAGAGISACAGTTVSLNGTAEGQQSVLWSAATGSFSNVSSLSTNYIIPANATGSIVLTLTATNICGAIESDTVTITITNAAVPNFNTTLTLCNGATPPVLSNTSPNGIVGTWNPATINNTTSGNYVFTPNANQCASAVTLVVTITNSVVPNFQTNLTICNGATPPVLSNTSPNGISGTWNPATINNSTSGNYIFTPNANQCASAVTLAVTVTNGIVPNFQTSLTICNGAPPPVLSSTSPNGITGTWNPTTISNTTSGNYIFTPNPNQCASAITLAVTVTNSIIPNFQTSLTICNGATPPVLSNTSPNGILGTWNPAVISNTTGGNYVFTPNPNQCASAVTLNVTVNDAIIPDFDTALTLCNGATPPVLATTSPNGIMGTWNPSVITNTANGNYVFTPNAGQCAVAMTLSVEIGSISFNVEQYCAGSAYVLEAVLNAGDSNAEYVWTDSSGTIAGSQMILNVSDWASAHPQASFPQIFTLTVASAEGCTATQNTTVSGIFCSIPKGISPNNDGLNDSFDLSGMNIRELSIYNRYGVKVFAATNYTNQWHGQTDNGDDLPDGTYYYLIENNAGNSQSGWIYISSNLN